MPGEEYQECPNCGETIRTDVDGVIVEFCYECGEELEPAVVRVNGVDMNGEEIY